MRFRNQKSPDADEGEEFRQDTVQPVGVHEEMQGEVQQDAPPNEKVVDDGPVRRVQRHLHVHNNHLKL